MRAIILAAGVGSRIGNVANGIPKCLLEVGGRPLIEHQLEAFADAGIGPVMVVVGYKAEEVKRVVGDRAEYVENPDPAGTNSMASFALTRDFARGSVLIANCDLLFHPAILDRLLDAGGSALAYDSSFGPGREKMKVALANGRLREMSKALPYENASGENVGLICLQADAAAALAARADDLVRQGRKKAWLAEAVEAVAQSVPIGGVDIAGLPWIEIDFPFDLHAAKKRVWPAIHRDRWKRAVRWRRTRWLVYALAAAVLSATIFTLGRRMAPPSENWESIPPAHAPVAPLRHKDGTQHWWFMWGDETAQAGVLGPVRLRLEIRPLQAVDPVRKNPVPGPAPTDFEIEFLVDGKPVETRSYRFEKDPDISYGKRYVVGARHRVEWNLENGLHTVGIRRKSGSVGQFLVRIREPERIEKD